MTRLMRYVGLAAMLALCINAGAQAAVVVSSKLSTESATIGEMLRLLLEANGIKTVDRMTL
ncbi:MAG TPA: hypothetical protein VKG05_03115, partial [Steroidobacteraceae bacterium]|nr:hypothetical protein [Steroidobacteraceae bacterium]